MSKLLRKKIDIKPDQWTLAEETVTTFLSYEENSFLSTTLPVLLGLVEGLTKNQKVKVRLRSHLFFQ